MPLPIALGAIAAALCIWWLRRGRTGVHRRSMRAFHALSEQIIAAGSPSEIAEKLVKALPGVTQATAVRLYLVNRSHGSLECVPTSADPDAAAIPMDSPPAGMASGAAACFRNRMLLNVPDVRRSPFVDVNARMDLPRAAMFVPLLAHNDVLGVLELSNARRRACFTPEQQAAAQHLANQVSASLKLREQQTMREQLFRSEKLAATGQLISGVAGELRAPLERILQLATSLAAYRGRPAPERELGELADESVHAAEIVSKLVSFARPEDSRARPVDVNALVAGLIQFREPEWNALGLRVRNRLAPSAASVLGARVQLEQVFLNLLVHAGQCASQAPGKTITVVSSIAARRLAVEIAFATPEDRTAGDPLAEGLGVCRGAIQSHGGEIRFQAGSGISRFEVDLPLTGGGEESLPAAQARMAPFAMTLLIVDPDPGPQHQLLGLLSLRGHRAVPTKLEEAADLVQRFRFDAVLWSMRPGSRWTEFRERFRPHVAALVLLNDGYDAELARGLEESGGFLLKRPIDESELDSVLLKIEARALNAEAARPAK